MSHNHIDVLKRIARGYHIGVYAQDGNTVATNSKIVVIMFGEADGVGKVEKAPDYRRVISEEKIFSAKHSSLMPPEECFINERDCYWCSGRGHLLPCKSCSGQGTHECECGHVHDCPDCQGRGNVKTANKLPESVDCSECSGSGKEPDEYLRTTFEHEGEKIDLANWLLAFMQDLGVKEFLWNDSESPAFFRFDGGFGAVMPVSRKGVTS